MLWVGRDVCDGEDGVIILWAGGGALNGGGAADYEGKDVNCGVWDVQVDGEV